MDTQNHDRELICFGEGLLENDEATEMPLIGRVAAPALRSVLYVPGHRRDWIKKCHQYGADAIVLDLEDAVSPEDRPAARKIIAEEIGGLAERVRSVWVRVNSNERDLPLDLEASVRPGISVIQLPKVFGPESVIRLDMLLGWLEGKAGMPYKKTIISPILETAGGLLRAYDIAMSSTRLEYLGAVIAPAGDTARALRMEFLSDSLGTESLYARQKVVIDARAAGVRSVIGGTVTDLAPEQKVLQTFSRANKAMGYTGSLVIHPSQVAIANEIFGYTESEINHARGVLSLLKDAGGRCAIRNPVNDEMIDIAHARHACDVLRESSHFARGFDSLIR